MTSEVEICNLALLRLGTRSNIASLCEGSIEANACARVYPLLRDILLTSHQWSFATRRVMLASLGNPPDRWAFRYAYPVDCLRARSIRPPEGYHVVIPFEVSGDVDALNTPIKVILCNLECAELLYTGQVLTSDLYPPHFVEALSWMIAAELANTLSGNSPVGQYAQQMAAQAIASSKANDANENIVPQDHSAEWISVRGYAHADPLWRRAL